MTVRCQLQIAESRQAKMIDICGEDLISPNFCFQSLEKNGDHESGDAESEDDGDEDVIADDWDEKYEFMIVGKDTQS